MAIITGIPKILKGNPVSAMILQSPDLTKWAVRPNSEGALKVTSGAAGTVTDIKVTTEGAIEASFDITNDGELVVKTDGDLSGTAVLDNNFRLRAEDGSAIYKLKVNSDNAIKLETV
jgi:hypothetical protein